MLAPRESPVELDSGCWLVGAPIDHTLFPVPCSCSSIGVSGKHLTYKLLSSDPYFRAGFWGTLIRSMLFLSLLAQSGLGEPGWA